MDVGGSAVQRPEYKVAAIFPPGTVIVDAAEELVRKLNRRLGHGRQAAE